MLSVVITTYLQFLTHDFICLNNLLIDYAMLRFLGAITQALNRNNRAKYVIGFIVHCLKNVYLLKYNY